MLSEQAKQNLATLTDGQKKAVEILLNNQKNRLFIGMMPGIVISDFVEINNLKKTDLGTAEVQEEELIKLCTQNPL